MRIETEFGFGYSVPMKAIQKRSLQTQEKILSAAESLLRDNPYSELTIPLVAKTAKVSVGGLYARFESRDALLLAVHDRYRERRDQRIDNLVKASEVAVSLEESVASVTRLFVELHLEEAGILRSFIIHNWLLSHTPPNEIKAEISNHIQQITDYVIKSQPCLESKTKRVSECIRYAISLSKDKIVITPDSMDELAQIDGEKLIKDITRMVLALIKSELN